MIHVTKRRVAGPKPNQRRKSEEMTIGCVIKITPKRNGAAVLSNGLWVNLRRTSCGGPPDLQTASTGIFDLQMMV